MTSETLVLILAVLLAVSEALALIPQVKANSIFQMILNILKSLVGKKSDAAAKKE